MNELLANIFYRHDECCEGGECDECDECGEGGGGGEGDECGECGEGGVYCIPSRVYDKAEIICSP